MISVISYNADDAKAVMAAFEGNCTQLVFCSSSAAYERTYVDLPISEDTQPLTTSMIYPYGFHKAEMERYLNSIMPTSKTKITIIRPALTFGRGGKNVGVMRGNAGIPERIRQASRWYCSGTAQSLQLHLHPDLAKGFVGVLLNPNAYSKAFHVTNSTSTPGKTCISHTARLWAWNRSLFTSPPR